MQKEHFKRTMMSSYLAWILPTTRNQIWEKQCVGRRKEETWRVLEQLEYSWERGHVHRERLKQAISGPAPLSPRSHTIHASSTPFTICDHPSQSTTAGPSCTVPIRTFEFMVSCLTLTNGRCEVGGRLRLSYHRGLQKKMAALVVVPWFL